MLSSEFDHIRTWEHDNFKLELFDTFQTDHGKSRLAYRFFDGAQLIFEGEDFCAAPLHTIDGDETVAGLLAFLSLRPGDTDPEYFGSYTPAQLEWCQSGRAEELSYLVNELEERAAKRRQFEDEVKHPGKFEGEAAYVPYFWEQYLNGSYSDDDGTTVSFDVDDEDRALFPELADTERVLLVEPDSGFVCEVSCN